MDHVLNTSDAAELLGLHSTRTVANLIRSGQLRGSFYGGAYHVRESAVEEFVEMQERRLAAWVGRHADRRESRGA